jgi:hypothetical protein
VFDLHFEKSDVPSSKSINYSTVDRLSEKITAMCSSRKKQVAEKGFGGFKNVA